MNDSPVERFVRHPRRRWIVGAATSVVGVIFLLPAVDSFTAACSHRDELLSQLDSGREELARLPEWQRRLDEQAVQLAQLQSQRLTDEMAARADVVVTMGCGDACPFVPGVRYIDWDLPDPKGRPRDEVRATREEITRRVGALLDDLNGA